MSFLLTLVAIVIVVGVILAVADRMDFARQRRAVRYQAEQEEIAREARRERGRMP